MVLVAVALLALIGSAALILLAGSVEWQKNQLQELADSTALDSALTIGTSCDSTKANVVLKEGDDFLATRRTKLGPYAVAAGTCATPYKGTDFFGGGLSATYNYPYRAHQQQVEVILTLALPISFGAELGTTNTTVTRRAVAQALPGSVPAISATSLTCGGGQVNVGGDVLAQNAIAISGTCALYAHSRFDAASGTYSSLGNVRVYADGQSWVGGGGACAPGLNSGSSNAVCADGSEVSGHLTPACGTTGTSQLLSAGGAAIDPNPCAAGVAAQPVFARSTLLPPDPNTDAVAIATLQGTGGAACSAGGVYPNIVVGGVTVGTGLAPAPVKDASGYYHFKPSCYGYLNPSLLDSKLAVLDAGFFYFNGSGFAGGGGLCLNSSTLLGRDVTLEFVNAAGFSAGTCTPGGSGPSTFWLEGTADCKAPGCHLQATDPSTGQQSVKYTPTVDSDIWSETTSNAGAQTVPAGTIYTLTYSSNGGRTINATVTLYYSVATPCAAPTGATNLISWAVPLPDFSGTGGNAVTSPASAAAVTIPGGAYLCLEVLGSTAAGNENFLYNNSNYPGKISSSSPILPAGSSSGCAAPCQFGSTPCSISVCPPNALADPLAPLGGNTWFAAPCSQAPPATGTQDTSCSGSWCPAGDRACQNLLIYEPAVATGQIALTGTAVRAWLLGTIDWSGACTYAINGTSTIDGALACGTLSISAALGAGIGVGSDYGISTATVEAILIE
ncbi:MAG TPA: hypothetical protein DCF65_09800 [Chloroflexi bacterium]|jgi:hypothetical protein|nr:hypothetical protein [Chloroflexota bacterium]HAF19850.1 hypothetical protein [Chloroflexota bacterium]